MIPCHDVAVNSFLREAITKNFLWTFSERGGGCFYLIVVGILGGKSQFWGVKAKFGG